MARNRRVDAVTRALELDAFQPARTLIHLKIGNQRYVAERHIAQHDIGVAVAEIQRPRQHRHAAAEMGKERAARLAPLNRLPQFREILRMRPRGEERQQ